VTAGVRTPAKLRSAKASVHPVAGDERQAFDLVSLGSPLGVGNRESGGPDELRGEPKTRNPGLALGVVQESPQSLVQGRAGLASTSKFSFPVHVWGPVC
jgi:hypothetical protein